MKRPAVVSTAYNTLEYLEWIRRELCTVTAAPVCELRYSASRPSSTWHLPAARLQQSGLGREVLFEVTPEGVADGVVRGMIRVGEDNKTRAQHVLAASTTKRGGQLPEAIRIGVRAPATGVCG